MTTALSLLVFVIGYLSYFLISHSKDIHLRLCRQFGEDRVSLPWVVFQRLAGVVCLGLFPGLLVLSLSFWRFSDLGLGINSFKTVLIWTIGLGICVLFISYFFSGRPENFKFYPQIRKNPWTIKIVILNTGSWLAYLVAYEFLFRGLLLFTLYSALGLWPSIGITTGLYVLVHFPKGPKEALGALPFGVVLGLITIEAGSIWPAVFIHAVLALSNDHFALRANPDMHSKVFVKK
ncbi:MAG: CPBP family intramembrane metalloprotease [Candidatus Aminicenantes bacterium]|nr:CPBP family intramembrane metalloprotease [Candidatus Aminicenantes bacterium]